MSSESLTLQQLKDIKKLASDLGAESCDNVSGATASLSIPGSAVSGDISGNAATASAAEQDSALEVAINAKADQSAMNTALAAKLDAPGTVTLPTFKYISDFENGAAQIIKQGAQSYDNFGYSVSMNADGTILAVGARHDDHDSTGNSNRGSVTVYIQNGTGGWSMLGDRIIQEVSYYQEKQGWSVSLSDSGFRVAVGAPGYNGDHGKVRVYQLEEYTGVGTGVWVQMGTNGTPLPDYMGYYMKWGSAISLSGDGNTLAIGASDNSGYSDEVRVFTWKPSNDGVANGSWYYEAHFPQTNSNDGTGYSVSLNNDGTIIAIGRLNYNSQRGRVSIYEKTENQLGEGKSPGLLNDGGSGWTLMGDSLDGELANDYFGHSVSLSADGTVLAIGAPYSDYPGTSAGHVEVWKYESNNWVQMGEDILGVSEYDNSGWSVSLNADGTMLAIGSNYADIQKNDEIAGHVRVFKYASDTWTLFGNVIEGYMGNDQFGHAVSLSKDGSTLAIGAPQADYSRGTLETRWDQGNVFVINVSTQALDITASSASTAFKVDSRVSSSTMGNLHIHKHLTIGEPSLTTTNSVFAAHLQIRTDSCKFFAATGEYYYFYSGGSVQFQIEPYSQGVKAHNYYSISDDRVKENEELIQNVTDTLLKLRPQTYDKKQSLNAEDTVPTKKEAGLIVQEIYYEVPELRFLLTIPEDATLIDDDKHANFNDIRNDPDYSNWGSEPGAINYAGLIPYLIQGFKEQHAAMEAQKATIAAQQAAIDALMARVAALEGQ
jgi:hypothetical protein